MYYIVIYDIPSDKLRAKLADICLDHGLLRIQYSAFFGEMELEHKRALLVKLKRRMGKIAGNVQVFPICDQDIKKREIIINPAGGDDE